MATNKQAISVRFSDEAMRLLEALSRKTGINRTAVLELIIREAAERRDVEPAEDPVTRPPRRYTEAELKSAGVTVLDLERAQFKCDGCGGVWSSDLRTGGKLPRGYWKCPHHGCNDPSR